MRLSTLKDVTQSQVTAIAKWDIEVCPSTYTGSLRISIKKKVFFTF